jgi:hypothetical protein
MKIVSRVYNQFRTTLLFCGITFFLLGGYGLFYPDEIQFYKRGFGEITDNEKLNHFILLFFAGLIMLAIRLLLMKYRRNSEFSKNIPLLRNVQFDKTDDVNENIQRHREAQLEAVKKLQK